MCGVIGIFGHPEASKLAYLGLHALQHRGQESAGIVSSDGQQLRWVREMGHVGEIFTESRLAQLPGSSAIGHVRYSTTGDSVLKNAQPLAVNYSHGSIAVAHNGNLVDAAEVRARLEAEGSIFQSTNDSEIILHLLARSREGDLPSRIADALRSVHGAYSLAFLTETSMIAVRDPLGIRPLSLGRHKKNGWVVASETCAFELIEAEYIRDIEPGEMLVVDGDGARTIEKRASGWEAQCGRGGVARLVHLDAAGSFPTLDHGNLRTIEARFTGRTAEYHAGTAGHQCPCHGVGQFGQIRTHLRGRLDLQIRSSQWG